MIPWELPGQEHAIAALSSAFAQEDYGHAWAFIGPKGVGQERAARLFAAVTNGAVSDTGQLDRFLRGTHPAITTFTPIGANHRKRDVSESWLPAANQTLIEGKVKVLHIHEADRMNMEAANAFLKTLEEPPAGTVWILDIANEQSIPDTILSRCRRVRFSPWRAEHLATLIPDHPDQALLIALSEGAPDKVAALASSVALGEYRQARTWVPDMLDRGPGMAMMATHALKGAIKRRSDAIEAEGKAAIAQLHEAYEKAPPTLVKHIDTQYKRLVRAERTATIQDALDACLGYLRDVIAVATNTEAPLRNVDARDRLIGDSTRISVTAAISISDRIQQTRDALEVNVAWELAIQALLLQAHTDCIVHRVGQ
ncbi:hypothetical protein [Stomatohabitans albus]|uniref:DNA polymerase III subunit n=1 Tax=Stomatohabitans albus TaxID=3110766 RepID=UPI00300CCBC9